MKITDWAAEDRPREKMMAKGSAALTNAELLAILLRMGDSKKTAVELAQEILNACDNKLTLLARMSLKDLQKIPAMGLTKAASILAAMEIGRRRAVEEPDNYIIRSSEDIFNYIAPRLMDLPHEELWALYLSKGGKILHAARISSGGTDFSGADVKMIVRPALDYMASNVALCHNHPHSRTLPSTQDRAVTKKVNMALQLFDLKLIDHIIVSDNEYFSFVDSGEPLM